MTTMTKHNKNFAAHDESNPNYEFVPLNHRDRVGHVFGADQICASLAEARLLNEFTEKDLADLDNLIIKVEDNYAKNGFSLTP